MKFFYKFFVVFLVIKVFLINLSFATTNEDSFEVWLSTYKKFALSEGVSKETINIAFKNVRFLEKVIKYDRKQPEFIEDTNTYVSKRANSSRVKTAQNLFKKNSNLFLDVEKKFSVEKEVLLALWGIETNFGKHVGKMDIIYCLATLSFDQRSSKFFSAQLLTLLELIDAKLVNPDNLYGSWAGAYGNFQFMPSSIKTYAIDYNNDSKIELKGSLEDSLASAANYIKSIGWKKNQPCFFRVKLTKNLDNKFINTSARKISKYLSVNKWKKKGVVNFDGSNLSSDFTALDITKAALIQPDGKPDTPAYLVFSNYEKILKWNRSLRFGISVCTLAEKIKT